MTDAACFKIIFKLKKKEKSQITNNKRAAYVFEIISEKIMEEMQRLSIRNKINKILDRRKHVLQVEVKSGA